LEIHCLSLHDALPILPKVKPGQESPELRLALRRMLLRRDTALELMAELGEPVTAFALAAHQHEGAEAIAQKLRAALGISVAEQRSEEHTSELQSRENL